MNSSIFWMERKKSFALWKLGISGLNNVKKVDKVKLHILTEKTILLKDDIARSGSFPWFRRTINPNECGSFESCFWMRQGKPPCLWYLQFGKCYNHET